MLMFLFDDINFWNLSYQILSAMGIWAMVLIVLVCFGSCFGKVGDDLGMYRFGFKIL